MNEDLTRPGTVLDLVDLITDWDEYSAAIARSRARHQARVDGPPPGALGFKGR